jgi:hypothetical protein
MAKQHDGKCDGAVQAILAEMRSFEARAHFELSETLATQSHKSATDIRHAAHRALYNNGQRVTRMLQLLTHRLCSNHKEELGSLNEAAREHYRKFFAFMQKSAQ